MRSNSQVRLLGTMTEPRRITGVLLTETGEVYLGVRDHCIEGEIRSRRIYHRDVQRGFLEEGESILNYEILWQVDEAFIEGLLRSLGSKEPICEGLLWVQVHGD